jgi:autoinducer 2-degrading protein
MHVVVVTFHIKPAFWSDFREAILVNAAASLANEPGCTCFDVCEDPAASTIFLYELYDDAAAFEVHVREKHFLDFSAATADWVEAKIVGRYQRVES